MLDVQDNHHLKILVFSAQNYLSEGVSSLYGYMYPKLVRVGEKRRRFVENLWV